MSISNFLETHFRHFNARETLAAAKAWRQHVEAGGKMLVALGGAMSTAELGISLSRMIRRGKVHAISCTAANLEEDIFNLIGHNEYPVIPAYRQLTIDGEEELRRQGLNRVTDTCIPESVVLEVVEKVAEFWREAAERNESYFPHEYLFRLVRERWVDDRLHVPREHSWVVAACDMQIPIYAPGFEDSTMGNMFTARVIRGEIKSHGAIRRGTEQMEHLVNWYRQTDREHSIGFFQIGGGIAGDFAICSVPLILQDLHETCRYWGYFAQISDSSTSYGSYSGAVPNEKITWNKLGADTPRFMIQSDATIVAPLIFAYVLGD